MPSDILISDILALIIFFLAWYSITWLSGYYFKKNKSSLYTLSKGVRTQWMLNLLERENRISDVSLLGHLMRSVSFFASTSLLILASLITVFGIVDDAIMVVSDIPGAVQVSSTFWELKLLLMVVIYIFIFFKLAWSIRQYNTTVIMVGAAPDKFATEKELYHYANNLGIVINRASRHYIDGMRGFEFSLAAIAWFLHPYLFIISTLIISLVSYRREFASRTMKAMDEK